MDSEAITTKISLAPYRLPIDDNIFLLPSKTSEALTSKISFKSPTGVIKGTKPFGVLALDQASRQELVSSHKSILLSLSNIGRIKTGLRTDSANGIFLSRSYRRTSDDLNLTLIFAR